MIFLGDPHNGQKRVYINADNKIYKPRCIYWEWMFLGKNSFLINHFKNNLINTSDLYPYWYSLLPSLNFLPDKGGYSSGYIDYQKVEKITQPILNENNWESFGAIIALFSFFGITDLHYENIIFGKNIDNEIKFGAIDIECIFNKLHLLSQTHLLPLNPTFDKSCGLSKLKDVFNLNPSGFYISSLIYGYLSFFDIYNDIYLKILYSKRIQKKPIRVIPCNTNIYKNYFYNKNIISKSEKEQLLRNDIPYFYRYIDSKEIYYYNINNGKYKLADLNDEIKKLLEENMFSSKTQLNHIKESLNLLKKAGSLQLLKYLKQGRDNKIYKNLKLLIRKEYIEIEFKNKLWGCKCL
ncbi:DUF4135 domain-containing protein [Fluviispira multicolorata]|uniref:DUF4135 domain-containing protein n=1 Tax=Fluviispira multicolorata TaxID=2654512 RepID=A0A833JDY6_9BACT|nr:DUF4135 domain-containing protein [Fluviispira multicolorata]KAB8032100.1 DUF4135 domain-containing protein [Fluviispira multicolorata]